MSVGKAAPVATAYTSEEAQRRVVLVVLVTLLAVGVLTVWKLATPNNVAGPGELEENAWNDADKSPDEEDSQGGVSMHLEGAMQAQNTPVRQPVSYASVSAGNAHLHGGGGGSSGDGEDVDADVGADADGCVYHFRQEYPTCPTVPLCHNGTQTALERRAAEEAWSRGIIDVYTNAILYRAVTMEEEYVSLAEIATTESENENDLTAFVQCMVDVLRTFDVAALSNAVRTVVGPAGGGFDGVCGAGHGTVIATLLNQGYDDDLAQFVKQMRRSGNEAYIGCLIVFSFDDAGMGYCRKHPDIGNCVRIPNVLTCQSHLDDAETPSLQLPPGTVWVSRMIVQHLLMCSGVDVAVSDLDAFWAKPILTASDGIESLVEVLARGSADDAVLAAAVSVPHAIVSTGSFPFALYDIWNTTVCMGWQYWQTHERAAALVHGGFIATLENPTLSDQLGMNEYLFQDGLVVHAVPRHVRSGWRVASVPRRGDVSGSSDGFGGQQGGGGGDEYSGDEGGVAIGGGAWHLHDPTADHVDVGPYPLVLIGEPLAFRGPCFGLTDDLRESAFVQHCDEDLRVDRHDGKAEVTVNQL